MFILLPVDTFRTLATVHALTQNVWLCVAVTLCLSHFFLLLLLCFASVCCQDWCLLSNGPIITALMALSTAVNLLPDKRH